MCSQSQGYVWFDMEHKCGDESMMDKCLVRHFWKDIWIRKSGLESYRKRNYGKKSFVGLSISMNDSVFKILENFAVKAFPDVLPVFNKYTIKEFNMANIPLNRTFEYHKFRYQRFPFKKTYLFKSFFINYLFLYKYTINTHNYLLSNITMTISCAYCVKPCKKRQEQPLHSI